MSIDYNENVVLVGSMYDSVIVVVFFDYFVVRDISFRVNFFFYLIVFFLYLEIMSF